jgi:hypothetical protein
MALPDFPSPHPRPITKVSPSLANDLMTCGLRVAFSQDPHFSTQWRRPNAFTALGSAAHAVTEAAFRRTDWAEDDATRRWQLEAQWDKEVTRSVDRLREAWAPALPPLGVLTCFGPT